MSVSKLHNRRNVIVTAALVALVVGGSWATAKAWRPPSPTPKTATVWAANPPEARILDQISFATGFAPIVKQVLPAVVNIASSKIIQSSGQNPMAPFYSDPFFRQFFGDDFSGQFRVPREQRERSLGSGVIISPEGHILTNNHVVEGATEIKISLADKRELKANVVGTDSRTDIAVLKIDAKDLPVVTFADSSNVQVGEFVLAVGNPFGVGQTVTMGIVSATGRGGLGIEDYEDFIQTDAAINPGNSGGAMINVHGGLIGINTAIISGAGGGNQGVGFAVPVNMAREVMDHIIKHGRVIRGWLGVVVQPLTPAVAKAFALPGQPRGALISDVAPDSPASRSGLAKGDIILLLNGDPVTDSRTLSLKISMLAPGTTIRLKTFREGRERDVSVTLSELPVKAARTGQTGIPSSGFELGISVQPLTAQAARQLGLPTQTQGVLVDDIEPGSQAGDAGIRRGDVIQEVNHKPVTSPDEFQRLINQSRNQTILFLINRGGDHLFIAIEPR